MFDPGGIDVVIPLGSGSRFKDLELRYCLRSLERYARGVRRVVIVGQQPKWLSDQATHVFCPYFDGAKDARIAHKMLWTFEQVDTTREILFANDDYVFLKEFDVREVPPYQKGTLWDASQPKAGHGEPGFYQQVLRATHDLLVLGKLNAYHYDIHVPIRYVREHFIALRPWWDKSKATRNGLVVKSIYANVTRRGIPPGPYLPDFKLARFTNVEEVDALLARYPGRFCLSYSDRPLYENFETWLYGRFPVKSRFEL
jgi:hypothetical protein